MFDSDVLAQTDEQENDLLKTNGSIIIFKVSLLKQSLTR